MGKASFLKIEDESGMLQVYVARDNLEENFIMIFSKNILKLEILLKLVVTHL